MSHRNFNEEELAAYLDRHLPAGGNEDTIPSGETDPLVETAARLYNAPEISLSDAARARMRARMMEALPVVPVSQPPRTIRFPAVLMAAAAAVAVFIIAVGLLVRTPDEDKAIAVVATETVTSAVTETASETVTIDATPTLSDLITEEVGGVDGEAEATAIPTTVASTVAPTVAPMVATTSAPTVVPTRVQPTVQPVTEIPVIAASPTMPNPDVVVLEGPIDAVEGNKIEVYGFTIQLAEDDPLLDLLEVDDFIRVEGDYEAVDSKIVIKATLAELIITVEDNDPNNDTDGTIDVIISNEEGEVWRDTGDCNNPPPPWAPANGWRARCENGGRGNNGRGNGN